MPRQAGIAERHGVVVRTAPDRLILPRTSYVLDERWPS